MPSEILFVTPEFAHAYKHLGEVEALLTRVRDIISDFKAANAYDMEAIDDSVVALRRLIEEKKQALSQLASAEAKEMDALFTQVEAQRKRVTERLSAIYASLGDLRREIEGINRALNRVDFSRLDRLLELVERLARMGSEERGLLFRLLAVTSEGGAVL